jgi:surface polysaccharide O-acyltransferase-like enzyme
MLDQGMGVKLAFGYNPFLKDMPSTKTRSLLVFNSITNTKVPLFFFLLDYFLIFDTKIQNPYMTF